MTLQERLAQMVSQLPQEELLIVPEKAPAVVEKTNPMTIDNREEPKPVDIVPGFAISIAEAKERIGRLQEFVRSMMQPNVDYGLIPGCPKPSLLKSGAEKLCDIFGFAKQLIVTSRIEDWDKAFILYEVKIILVNKRTGLVEAEGIGSCNCRERKYLKQDPYNIANTLLKMAKKRALIDAVLSATRSSGLFCQDLEDTFIHPVPDKQQSEQPKEAVTITAAASFDSCSSSVIKPTNDLPLPIMTALATEAQLKFLRSLVARKKISNSDARTIIKDRFGVESSVELSKAQASHLIDWLHTR